MIGSVTSVALICEMFSETVEIRGHIIDSLTLPKVLDAILLGSGTFKILEIQIGQKRADQSFARIEISGPNQEKFDAVVLRLRELGAEVTKISDDSPASSQPKPAA